ncbi:MAG TPA: TetR/AcrR family transcriptional regulator [Cellulomonadaceae bacterium]|nr:TetR/AcrR family transcriptional regulator [Cellulomonadaceae bacterium]
MPTSPLPKGERTRRTIVDHAVATAYRVGLGRLTIGDLASGTGLSKSGLYAHFGSKETLQLAVLDEAAARFAVAVVRPALQAPRGETRLRTLFDRWMTCGMSRDPGVCLFVKAATELDEQPGAVRDRLVELHRALIATIETIVRNDDGAFHADADGRQLAADVYGVMLSFYLAHRLLQDLAAERRARTAFEALLAALARGPSPELPPALPSTESDQTTRSRS